jgi:hypothetical protein
MAFISNVKHPLNATNTNISCFLSSSLGFLFHTAANNPSKKFTAYPAFQLPPDNDVGWVA